jgi:hypothetical protein
MKKLIFLIVILFNYKLTAQGIKPETDNANNIIFKEYVNPSNAVIEVFPIYNSNGTRDYDVAVNKALEFNNSYDKNNFSILVFHGRYYIDVEQISVPKKGWSTQEKDTAIQKGRLKTLKQKYKISKHAELGEYFIQDVRKRLETAIKGKVGNNHRFIVLCATEVYYLSYKSFETANNNVNNPAAGVRSYYKYFFWHTSNLNNEEQKMVDEVRKVFLGKQNLINSNTQENVSINSYDYLKGETFEKTLKNNVELIVNNLKYFKLLNDAAGDCNKLDELFEQAPSLFINSLNDESKFSYLKLIAGCQMNKFGTNEKKAVLNLLNGIQNKKWLYDKLFDEKALLWRLYEADDIITETDDYGAEIASIYTNLMEEAGHKNPQTGRFIFVGKATGSEYANNSFLKNVPYALLNPSGKEFDTRQIIIKCAISSGGEERKAISNFTCHPLNPVRVFFNTEENAVTLSAIQAYNIGIIGNRRTYLNKLQFFSKFLKNPIAKEVLDRVLGEDEFNERLSTLLLSALEGKINLLDNTQKANFIADFKNHSDDDLRILDGDVSLVDEWLNIRYLMSYRRDVNFLLAMRPAKEVVTHLEGELLVEIKTYGYKLQVKGYHIEVPEIDIIPPLIGNAGIPNPTNSSLPPTVVIIGTPANPAHKGKFRISDIRNYINDDMPYTAKIDVEIPIGSGYFFPKKGVDGVNTESGRSSMFPKNWNMDKIIEEIAYVRSRINTSTPLNSDNTYSSFNSHGTFEIKMYINGNRNDYSTNIGSAFPKVL